MCRNLEKIDRRESRITKRFDFSHNSTLKCTCNCLVIWFHQNKNKNKEKKSRKAYFMDIDVNDVKQGPSIN